MEHNLVSVLGLVSKMADWISKTFGVIYYSFFLLLMLSLSAPPQESIIE